MEKQIRGRELRAPARNVKFDGVEYPLKFDNAALCLAEDIYAEQYHRDLGIYQIMQECAIPRQRAIMAVFYAAMISGGAQIEWSAFMERFRITDIDGMTEVLSGALLDSLPDPEPGKNA